MDLSEPASVMIGRRSAAVLRALARTDAAHTGRQIARMAEVSPSQTARVLQQLAEHGLLLVEEQGSGNLYRLNREHLAAEALAHLALLRQRLLTLLTTEIGAWPLAPIHASLFGSAARGDGGTGSDLDILLIRPEKVGEEDDQWSQQQFDTGERLRRATGNPTAWFDISLADLARAVQAEEPVIAEWRSDGLLLAGERLTTLLRRIT